MKKFILLLALMVLFCSTLTVNATGIADTDTGVVDSLGNATSTTETTTEDSGYSMEDDINNGVSIVTDSLPDVSVDDVDAYVQKKGGQIVYLWQKIALFGVVAIFVYCCIMSLTGLFSSNKKNLGVGLGGIVVCGVIFAAIYYAPQLLEIFRGFLAS